MTLSPGHAADSLKEIEQTAWRSASAYRYQKASWQLFLWGVIWILGYGGSDLYPRRANVIWLALLLLAMVISTLLGRRDFAAGAQAQGTPGVWRYPVAFVIVWAFIGETYAIMGHVSAAQQGAFPPLMVAAAYMVCGLWRRTRLLVTGIALAVLTLLGFFRLHDHFLLWEGFVGGGSLILAGLWFRKV